MIKARITLGAESAVVAFPDVAIEPGPLALLVESTFVTGAHAAYNPRRGGPYSGFDRTNVDEVRDGLRALVDKGASVVIVEQPPPSTGVVPYLDNDDRNASVRRARLPRGDPNLLPDPPGLDLAKSFGERAGHKYTKRTRGADGKWHYEYADVVVGAKAEIDFKNMHPFTARVTHVDGDEVHVAQSDDGYAVPMPKESFKHFVNDLNGRVDVPQGDDPDVNRVASGEAELLGKGDDGLVFRSGDNVVKVSTTVPYQPFNRGHLTPKGAADRLEQQTATNNAMADDGVPGIMRARLVKQGDKAFQIKPYVEIPEKLTRAQLDEVAESVLAAHAKGWVFNDQIQVGLLDGKIVHFDTGKASRSKIDPDRPKHFGTDKENDIERLQHLYSANGERYLTEKEKIDPMKEWDELAGANPATMSEDEKRKHRAAIFRHTVMVGSFLKNHPDHWAAGEGWWAEERKRVNAKFAPTPGIAKSGAHGGHKYLKRYATGDAKRPWRYVYEDNQPNLPLRTTKDVLRDEAEDFGVHLSHYFASGSNHEGEIQGFASIGMNVGVAAPETGKAAEAALKKLAGTGTKVFVDSGAFSEIGFGPQGPYVKEPITDDEWNKRLDLYARLADSLGSQLYAVAPDKVAFQDDTYARLEKYARRIYQLRKRGANILVPLQKGALSLAEFDMKVEMLLGPDYIRAIPMKKDATTTADFEEFLRERQPKQIHLLGLGPQSDRYIEVMEAVRTLSPHTEVFLDSVRVTAGVERPKQKPDGSWTKPRKLTAAQDRVRLRARSEAFSRDSYGDAIGDPSSWMPKALREETAKRLNLTGDLQKKFVKDPSGFLKALPGSWHADPVLALEMDRAWAEWYPEGGTTVERKRDSIREVFGGVTPLHLKTRAQVHAAVHERVLPPHRLRASDGIIATKTYDATAKPLHHRLKDGDPAAAEQMAREMAPHVPRDAVLVPMPGRKGSGGAGLLLANHLAKLTGRPVADVLRGKDRASLYEHKKAGGDPGTIDLGFHQKGSLPKGTPVVVDNVVGTGTSARAAQAAIPGAVVLVHAIDHTAHKPMATRMALDKWESLVDAEGAHREAVSYAVRTHEMTADEYQKLHAADYGPLADFLADPERGDWPVMPPSARRGAQLDPVPYSEKEPRKRPS